MIPRANITAWRARAPWPLDEQVEQDLVLSRALCEMFARPALQEMLAFRGGTALHKLYFDPPGRYSEDLDLVQVTGGPIKPVLLEIQAALDGWLGPASSQQSTDSVKLLYGFETTAQPVRRMRVKIEINTREHLSVEGFRKVSFAVNNPWYAATAQVTTYTLEELMATKLRALYQRNKGRDLYDLWLALKTLTPDEERVVAAFAAYLEQRGPSVSRAQYEANLSRKVTSAEFRSDVVLLLRDESGYDVEDVYRSVHDRLIAQIPGAP